MANAEQGRDEGDAAALARLVDPVALEARLADARARRAAVLTARDHYPPDGPVLKNLPGLALRGAAVILTGLTVVAAIGSLLLARPFPAPEVVLTAATPSRPAALPFIPSPGDAAGWQEASLAPPLLAALALSPPLPSRLSGPAPRPADLATAATTAATTAAMVPATAASKARTASAPGLAAASPVLRRAAAAAFLPMITRSAALLPYPLVQDDGDRPTRRAAPKRVRQPAGLVEQITRAGRSVVRDITRDISRSVTRNDPGDSLARSMRRASAVLNDKGRSGGWDSRPGLDKSARHQRSAPDKRGPDKASTRGKGNGKAAGNAKGKGSGKGGGKGSGKGGGKGGQR